MGVVAHASGALLVLHQGGVGVRGAQLVVAPPAVLLLKLRSQNPFSDSFSTLDFSHLRAKGVGYARHQSPLKEVSKLRTLPPKMVQALAPFAPLFSKRVWQHAQLLLIGAILAPGRRTVSSALRAMGLDQYERFHRYHRVLSRARWSSLEVGRISLGLLVEASSEGSPLVVGIDETLERRYGKRIAAKGVYRDPCVPPTKTSLRAASSSWVCVMLLVEVPGLPGCGPCPSSRLWLPPSVMLPSGVDGIRR